MVGWSDLSGRLQQVERLVRILPIALASADARRRVRFWNPAFEKLFLYKAEEIQGKNLETLVGLRDDQQAAAAVQRLTHGEYVRLTTRGRRKDRSVVDIEFHGVPQAANGRFMGYWGLFEDISELKDRERALHLSEEKFAKAFLTTPTTASLSTAPDNRLIDVNNTWVRLTGYQREEAIGRTPVELGLVDDADFQQINQHVEARGGRLRDFECRFRARDGTVRDGSVSIEQFVVNGLALRMTLVADITPRRNTEASLSRISQILLQNHEEERVRIAHELHDDIGQRLAAWQLGLDRLARDLRGPNSALRSRLNELRTQATAISSVVQALSSELYSAPLSLLTIDVALERLCAELSERLDMDIAFTRRDVPDAMPADVSLCLFRVAQDALGHIAKHGGSRRAEIELRGADGTIHLCVREYGHAFSVDDGLAAQLPVITMRERVALLKGRFALTWMAGGETQVDIAIPLPASGAAMA
ncbi:MAG TPA: PAS domain S-box protein [Vicinamibacterales bacterium]